MKTSELIRLLKKHGCYKVPGGTRHDMYYSPITGKTRHKSQEVALGTANAILKDAGIKH